MNGLSDNKLKKLRDKFYRDAYVRARIKIGIPYQIRALREQDGRNWSQAELGRRARKPSNVISRLENPEYGQLTIRTLLELASAFDVALLVKFVSYSRFLREFEDVSPQAMEVPSFTCDPGLMGVGQLASEGIPTNVTNAPLPIGEPQIAVAHLVESDPDINTTWVMVVLPNEETFMAKLASPSGFAVEPESSVLSSALYQTHSIGSLT